MLGMEKIPGSSKHVGGKYEERGSPKTRDQSHMVLSPEIISIRHKNPHLGYGNDQFPYYRALSFTQVPQIKRNMGMLYRQWIWN